MAPSTTILSPCFRPLRISAVRVPRAQCHRALLHSLVVLEDEHELLVGVGEERLLRHGDGIAGAARQFDSEQQPGAEQTVRVGDARLNRNRAGGGVHARVDARDLPLEQLVRPGRAARLDGLPERDLREERFRTLKSTLTTLRSSSVVMTVPGLTSVPGLTLRMPSTPSKGAVMILSLSRACAAWNRAVAASRAPCAVSDSS